MNPYSHLVLAKRLLDLAQPANLADYYWGNVAPDLRYTARLPRPQTHLPIEQILALRAEYPNLSSFLQGYLIHCLADEVELWALLEKRWYLRPFVQRVSLKMASVVLESYLVEKIPLRVPVSGAQNSMLLALGVSDPAVIQFHSLVERLVDQPGIASVLHLFRTLSEGRPAIGRVINQLERFYWARTPLYVLTQPSHLLDAVEAHVRQRFRWDE